MKKWLIPTVLALLVASPVAASDLSDTARLPEDSRDTALRAALRFRAQRYDEAAGLYRVIIQIHPDCLYAWANLGVVRFEQGQYDKAREAFAQAITLDPKDDSCLVDLGMVEYELGHYPDAIRHLLAAIELQSDNEAAHEYLGFAYDKLGRYPEAQAEAEKAEVLKRKRSFHDIRDTIEDDSSRNSS
jgi:tetratricopeptide (TPR) repeat protein